jgi:hypothetical protein
MASDDDLFTVLLKSVAKCQVLWDVSACQVVSDDDEDTRILRNVGSYMPTYIAFYTGRPETLTAPLQEPEILRSLVALKFQAVRQLVRSDTMADGFCQEATESLVPRYDKCLPCGGNCVKSSGVAGQLNG